MAPGLQEDILDLLEIKMKAMIDRERDCVLILDEVQLKRKIEYDPALKCLTGYVSHELRRTPDEEASHALVFMIKGLCKPYKQCVAWFLTGAGTSGDKLWSLTTSVLNALHHRCMRVRVVTSDMGPSNVGMWKAAGLDINTSNSDCSIPHPCTDVERLYFMADVPHLIKNMRNCLEKNLIMLSEDTVTSACLPIRYAEMKHIEAVVNIQETNELRLAPGLTKKVVHPGQYGKMKLSTATKVFSHSTACALEQLSASGSIDPNARTTAWLCEQVNRWFDMMSNRTFKQSLFTYSSSQVDELNRMIEIIEGCRVINKRGVSGSLQPWQKGMILSTKTVINLYNELVLNGEYTFLLTCRLTQDCLENLFSQIRGLGDAHPTVVRFRTCLKHITLSQLLDVPKTGSYEIDAVPNLIDFIKTSKLHEAGDEEVAQVMLAVGTKLSYLEEQSVYYLSGWVAHKLTSKVDCKDCKEILTTSAPTSREADLQP